ncbi:MAG: FG-GAP repeat protein [Myxococcales bacterium]|nr:FG-GAP repeat protein [Myxococcales bacterium]
MMGGLLGGAEAAARVQHAERTEPFPRDESRRAMRLGPMRGDPRGAVDAGLRAAFVAAVQRSASEHFWGLQPLSAVRWRAQEDGAGFELDKRGVWLVPAVREGEREAPRARLVFAAMGRGGQWHRVDAVMPRVRGNRAEYEREVGGVGVTEQWLHGPLGIEQVLWIEERLGGRGRLGLVMRVEGALRPRLRGGEVELVDRGGVVRGRYGELYVRDARGERVGARLVVEGERVVIEVEDEGAEYPLEVDPLVWVEQGRLNARDGSREDSFGSSVALTSDGSRALVGAPGGDFFSNMDQGFAYVFVRTGTSWREEPKLTASDGAVNERFGASVALAADGSRALMGAPEDDIGSNDDQGSAYVFLLGLTDGEACASAGQCLSGSCVHGVCCESESCSDEGGNGDGGMADGAVADGGGSDGGVMQPEDGGDAMAGDGGTAPDPASEGGCSCRVPRPGREAGWGLASMLLGLAVLGRVRRRRR